MTLKLRMLGGRVEALLDSLAVVFEAPGQMSLRRVALTDPADTDVVVDVETSGISTGTERLLWTGRMPPFPGMGYPLVPGYEAVGRVTAAGPLARDRIGDRVFVPGSRGFGEVRGLFGAAAARIVAPASRVMTIDFDGDSATLLALAATAYHAIGPDGAAPPDLIVGHGALGRLLARLAVARGGSPTVWETASARRWGEAGYAVIDPAQDSRRDYRTICDVSGDSEILDSLTARLVRGGEIVLAGFYSARVTFAFPPAFLREARIRIAAEWNNDDLAAVCRLVREGRLSLDGLITHRLPAAQAENAYRTAFEDPDCLKMILDWRACS